MNHVTTLFRVIAPLPSWRTTLRMSTSLSKVYFHGESYVAGTLDTHDWLCSALAQLSQAAVLSVEYRRPPEAGTSFCMCSIRFEDLK